MEQLLEKNNRYLDQINRSLNNMESYLKAISGKVNDIERKIKR